jgi:hypothetical protein
LPTAGSSAAGAYRQGIPGETLGQGQSLATVAQDFSLPSSCPVNSHRNFVLFLVKVDYDFLY